MNEPLKIGVVVMRFPVPSETFIVTKIVGLIDAGFDVQIFANASSDDWNKFDILRDRPNVRRRVHIAPPFRPLSKVLTVGTLRLLRTALTHPTDFLRFVRHNWQHRRENTPGFLKGIYTRLHFVGQKLDVLHIEFDTQALTFVDLKAYLKCKLLLSSRGSFQKTSVLDQFPDAPQVLYRHADGYHFISNYLHENARRLGLPGSIPTWLVEPAIDLELFNPIERPPRQAGDVFRIVSVGRLAWKNGFEFAIDAVGMLHRAGVPVHYTIVGDGDYREAAVFAARQWGLLDAGIVEFVGVVPRESVPGYLQAADAMLHISVEEGFCNAVIEAQAVELPVVVSDAGGLPENVANEVTGYVVPRRDPAAAAEKLRYLAENPALCREMGRAGRERAVTLFDINRQVEKFGALYRELTALGENE
ncbi:MAG: glycosyltransferase family 4 protein [Anaerolineae bacterium]|nr:glycosyltransferase family 4 protein [Anaerolineae bacterium]